MATKLSGYLRNIEQKEHLLRDALFIPFVSLIKFEDFMTYKFFFEKENMKSEYRKATYSNSWLYITQACRGFGLGLKFYDTNLLLSIGCQYKDKKWHYVIVRPLGCIDERFTELLIILQRISRQPVFIKKMFPAQIERFNRLSVRMCIEPLMSSSKYPWSGIEKNDDDTYPELIYHVLASTAPLQEKHLMSGKDNVWDKQFYYLSKANFRSSYMKSIRRKYKTMWEKIRHFERVYEKYDGPPFFFKKYSYDQYESVVRVLDSYYYFHGEYEQKSAYDNIVESQVHLLPKHENYLFSYIVYFGSIDNPIGFFAAEKIDDVSVGLYAAIILRKKFPGGLSEFLHKQFISILKKKGFLYISRGGSETKGLYKFKEKFAPVESRYIPIKVFSLNNAELNIRD